MLEVIKPEILRRDLESQVIPSDIARKIASDPSRFPRSLVQFAETTIRREIEDGITPVIDITQAEGWLV
jgi:hypothetical protein